MKRKVSPKISVIIPVYNVGNYLAQAIDSVITQTLSFANNVEIILINDGSTDNSDTICQSYAAEYPDNIVYRTQKNAGVSAARNHGLKLARGEYIHFFDGDDIISKNFYEHSLEFLEYNETAPFVASKLKFFDEIIDPHPLNYKFDQTRLIKLADEPDSPIVHVISAVFRCSAIKQIRFDEKLSIAEDMKFLSDVLLQHRQFGVLKNTTYHYRKRSDGSSAIGGRLENPDNYLPIVERVYRHILDTWQADAWQIEQTILYDIAYRLDQSKQTVLTKPGEQRYKLALKQILADIANASIIKSRHLSIAQKVFALSQQTNDFHQKLTVNDGVLYFQDQVLYDFHHSSTFLDFLTVRSGDNYNVEGYVKNYFAIPNVKYFAKTGEKLTALKFVPRQQLEKSFLGDVYQSGGAFEVEINIPKNSQLSFVVQIGDTVVELPIETGPFTKLGALRWTYRRDRDRLVKKAPTTLQSIAYSRPRHTALELRMWLQILLNWRLNTMRQRLIMLRGRNLKFLSLKAKLMELAKPLAFSAEAIYYIPRALLLRSAYHLAKPWQKRPLWIISDRPMAAGDNGEALFRYALAQARSHNYDIYFALSKKSVDFERLAVIGPVLNTNSLGYKLKFLLADKIISSQADIETTNPFIRQRDHFGDLFGFDFVFLQHGIIRHDHTAWLSRFDKNIQLFITSAQKEYDSILNYPYYYLKNQVLLSGLPRYDHLESKPANKLILAPTYRYSLVHARTDRIGRRAYDPLFKHSQYHQFYNRLINDERLLAAMRACNMTGEFYLHQVFSEQRADFSANDVFDLPKFPYDYSKVFREGNLLVSDHSSVVFDFAYLKKPVFYAHFDTEQFFKGHRYTKSDFFDDEKDGFGEVCGDYDSLVAAVTTSIKQGCKMDAKYQTRVDKFFYKTDKNNSQRVYDAIIEMNRNRK